MQSPTPAPDPASSSDSGVASSASASGETKSSTLPWSYSARAGSSFSNPFSSVSGCGSRSRDPSTHSSHSGRVSSGSVTSPQVMII